MVKLYLGRGVAILGELHRIICIPTRGELQQAAGPSAVCCSACEESDGAVANHVYQLIELQFMQEVNTGQKLRTEQGYCSEIYGLGSGSVF